LLVRGYLEVVSGVQVTWRWE